MCRHYYTKFFAKFTQFDIRLRVEITTASMKSKYVSSLVRYFPVCRQWCRVSLVWWVTGLSFRSYKGSVHLDDWGNFQSSFRARGFKCTFGPVPIKSGWRVTIYIWVLYWSELVNIQYDKSEGCTRCRNVSGIVCVCVYLYTYIYTYIYTNYNLHIYVHTYIHTYMHAFIHTPDTLQHHLKSAMVRNYFSIYPPT